MHSVGRRGRHAQVAWRDHSPLVFFVAGKFIVGLQIVPTYIDRLREFDALIWGPSCIHGGADCGDIFLQAVREADYRTEFALLCRLDPATHLNGFATSEGGAKTESELAQRDHVWTLNGYTVQELLLLVGHLLGSPGDEDGGMLGGNSFRTVGRYSFAGSSPTGNESRRHGTFSAITLLLNLVVKTGGVVTTFIPALLEIVSKVVHFCRLTVRRFPFGKLPSPQPAPNSLPSDPQDVADSRLRLAGIEQGYDMPIALHAVFSAQLRLRG